MRGTIKLLDCTLRDGGYINDWKFGKNSIKEIIRALINANVDIVEMGFLRKADDYTPSKDAARWERIVDLEQYLPKDLKQTVMGAMCIHNFYDTTFLPDAEKTSIRMLRVTFHHYDYREGLAFCKRAAEKGYLIGCNPINIMGYGDDELLRLIEAVNEVHPYVFSIVDTFGSMMQNDLNRIISLVEHNLEQGIMLGLHLHENLSQSFWLAQYFLNQQLRRDVIIDGSLMGMGRTPGNLPLELMANYLNENFDANYKIDCMLDTIEDHISPLKGKCEWGYSPAYFLSARYNLHRNYAQYYLDKGNLTHRDMNHILSRITKEKKLLFDAEYAETLYRQYVGQEADDEEDRKRLKERLADCQVVILAPGKTLLSYRQQIKKETEEKNTVVITCNFISEEFPADMVFFNNAKRYEKYKSVCHCPIIATSNIEEKTEYYFDFNSLTDTNGPEDNSFLMLLRLLGNLNVRRIKAAGADGYRDDAEDYYDSGIHSFHAHGDNYNRRMAAAIQTQKVEVEFITPSLYDHHRRDVLQSTNDNHAERTDE